MKVFIAILGVVVLALTVFAMWPKTTDSTDNSKATGTVEVAVTEAVANSSASRSEVTSLERPDGKARPEPGIYSAEEYAQFKEDYNCELAINARAQCETVDRGPDGLERCLKLSQYYTYSRHCGEQPD